MLTRADLRAQLERHIEGLLTLEDLSAWAEQAFRTEPFEPGHHDQIARALSLLRDATDPHRFRWEEPDFGALLDDLAE
jgi:hypothetical protein